MHDDLSLLLNSLNDAQRQAVAAPLGRQLVLAGAGSGKTRVLVHRIAWLHQVERASLHSILSVTFTNKAAAEMRQRIEQLLHVNPQGMWVGTFHGLAHRLLRAHWREAKLAENFQILDSDDQQRLVKRVIRELGLDEQRWPARQAQWWINAQKDEGLRPRNIQPGGDLFLATQLKIYEAYEEACARAGVIDFSELLLRALDLWRDHPGLLEHYQRRFRHVLVDEFQDTNAVQYAWLRLLAKGGESLMVVGDDDQSIYGWRGARIENLHQFSADFPDAETIRLEQNYRSTACILKAANALIANNQGRLGKELWTSGCEGEPISLYAAFNEHDEARYVVESIEKAIRDGMSRSEIAILYRSNAQSRVLEEALLREKIPYRIYGGQRFFERAEIKNAMAYLRLLEGRGNDEDKFAYLRDVRQYRNLLLVELPNGDFGVTLMRQFLFDAFHIELLRALKTSSDSRVADIAAKAEKEVAYHLERSADLVIRLGDGSEESRARMQAALTKLWSYTGEMFVDDAVDGAMADAGIAPLPSSLKPAWDRTVAAVLDEATLAAPAEAWQHGVKTPGGKKGIHTEHLGYILAEMQFLQRAYPGARW